MKKSRPTAEQIASALRQAKSTMQVQSPARRDRLVTDLNR